MSIYDFYKEENNFNDLYLGIYLSCTYLGLHKEECKFLMMYHLQVPLGHSLLKMTRLIAGP